MSENRHEAVLVSRYLHRQRFAPAYGGRIVVERPAMRRYFPRARRVFAQARQESRVFRVEAARAIVSGHPYRTDRPVVQPKWKQQNLLDCRRPALEIRKVPDRAPHELERTRIERCATRAERARQCCPNVRS